MRPRSILFVCLGNICRSPLAEGVFRHAVTARGLQPMTITSAGLGGWHAGEPPDPRAIRIAAQSGIDISAQRAHQIEPSDFGRFDLILGMDRSNVENLGRLRPASATADIALFLEHALGHVEDVPDPYYGGDAGFRDALALIETAAGALIEKISA